MQLSCRTLCMSVEILASPSSKQGNCFKLWDGVFHRFACQMHFYVCYQIFECSPVSIACLAGNAKQRVIAFMHNMDHRSAEAAQPTAKAKADQDEWRELEGSVDLVVDLVFDEDRWDLQLPQNALGIDRIASHLLLCANI